MSCTPEKMMFVYLLKILEEFLRVDSLYYSRDFSNEEKIHKNLIYTADDRIWFNRAIFSGIREVMHFVLRHCPFEDKYGVIKGANYNHEKLYVNIRSDLVKKEYYEELRCAISDFLRSYFICEWLKNKNTPAYLIAYKDYEEKKASLLTASLNLKKCNKHKGRRGWY